MPRRFTVDLANGTPYRLMREAISVAHGSWQIEPPPSMEPNEQVLWVTTSPQVPIFGIFAGTEGAVRFRVHDEGAASGPPGCITLGWQNPFSGDASWAVDYAECGRDLSSRLGLADVKQTDVFRNRLEDTLNPVSWLIPGQADDVTLSCRLVAKGSSGLALERPLDPPLPIADSYFTPATSSRPSQWSGKWGDRPQNPTRLVVDLFPHGDRFTANVEERRAVSLSQDDVAVAERSLPPYAGDRWPPGASSLLGERSSIAAVLAAAAVRPLQTLIRRLLGTPVPQAIELQQQIVLQLYEQRERRTRNVIAHRLRYLRRSLTGKVETDVLLWPTAIIA
jgi:hypothetical protein